MRLTEATGMCPADRVAVTAISRLLRQMSREVGHGGIEAGCNRRVS